MGMNSLKIIIAVFTYFQAKGLGFEIINSSRHKGRTKYSIKNLVKTDKKGDYTSWKYIFKNLTKVIIEE
jgi:hypothetical protein